MDPNDITFGGAFIFLACTLAYIIFCVFILFKMVQRSKKKQKIRREAAIREGRQVKAYLKDCKWELDRDATDRYRALYAYIAPDGREYEMKIQESTGPCKPSESFTIYLHPNNHRKYYSEAEMYAGKHLGCLTFLCLAAGYVIYGVIVKFIFS